MRMPMNPWITNSLLDTCAFDPKFEPEASASSDIFQLQKEEDLMIILSHTVTREIDHPNTPKWVKEKVQEQIFTVHVGLNFEEEKRRIKIHSSLTGNGDPAKYAQDANHIFEAQKYGSYFVTTDNRILKKGPDIERFCPVRILKPTEFLAIVLAYKPA